jgi:tRNA(adenine34) deaminase
MALLMLACLGALAVAIPLALLLISRSGLGVDAPDRAFLDVAYAEASRALAEGETPVGSVLVIAGEVVASGHSTVQKHADHRHHAEMNAINAALQALGVESFDEVEGAATLYTTYEPCAMCEGFILWKNVRRVVVGKNKSLGHLLATQLGRRARYRLFRRGGIGAERQQQLIARWQDVQQGKTDR